MNKRIALIVFAAPVGILATTSVAQSAEPCTLGGRRGRERHQAGQCK